MLICSHYQFHNFIKLKIHQLFLYLFNSFLINLVRTFLLHPLQSLKITQKSQKFAAIELQICTLHHQVPYSPNSSLSFFKRFNQIPMETIEPFYYALKLPHFFLIFVFIYGIAHKVFQNWGPKSRYEACSCFMSLFHGTPSVVLSLFSMFIIKDNQNPENPSMDFGSQNTPFQNLVIEFSTSYFIMDLLHYFVFKPDDVLFIAHHLATLFVLLTCRFLVNHGAFDILVILVLAEVTSPFQNVWSLARLRKNDVPAAKRLYDFMSPGFYAFYTVVRGALAPVYVAKLGLVYASGVVDGKIPTWAWSSWILITSGGILASMLWILNHWIVYYKEKIMKPKLV